MRTILSLLLAIITLPLVAQRTCASHDYTLQEALRNPSYAENINRAEAFIKQAASRSLTTASRTTTNIIIKIPVVVHVLYNTPAQNITDEQIKSQLAALNRDFRRKNADSVNTPGRFSEIAADVEIEFVLATADPMGRATTGIVRKHTNTTYWQSDDNIKFSNKGGDDAWDSKSYLNIWVGAMRTLLGYASSPGGPAEKDGLVINTTAFGTINISGAYGMGRTAVHEAGHWLGLRHIWGDDACGDDYVDDTPKQGGFTSGCPNGFRSSCSNGTQGDMYMNYMDFTNDACMNLFTEGQKSRMRSLFANGGPRFSLLSSKGLYKPWTEEAALPAETSLPEKVMPSAVNIYPNPAVQEVTISTGANNSWIGGTVTLINASGTIVKAITITTANQKIDMANFSPGLYIIQLVNGDKKIKQKLVKL